MQKSQVYCSQGLNALSSYCSVIILLQDGQCPNDHHFANGKTEPSKRQGASSRQSGISFHMTLLLVASAGWGTARHHCSSVPRNQTPCKQS